MEVLIEKGVHILRRSDGKTRKVEPGESLAEVAASFFADEPLDVPPVVSARQARLALLGADLLDHVEAAIAAIPDERIRRATAIEWEYATEVRRESAFIAALAPGLGLNDEQVDALFIAAAAL